MTIAVADACGSFFARFWKALSTGAFAFCALLALTVAMANTPGQTVMMMKAEDARVAVIDDTTDVLIAALIECNLIPRSVMGVVLQGLADAMIRKAKAEMTEDARVYPAELFDRARSLSQMAARHSRTSH